MLEKYSELINGINLKNAAIILGNGASISISKKFSYKNLFLKASEIDDFPALIFDTLNTTNFESVIYQLDIAQKINKAITSTSPQIAQLNQLISDTNITIRQSLIQTIQSIHPEYSSLSFITASGETIKKLFCYLIQFEYIINLNYDLLIYYILLHQSQNNKFTDFFLPDSTANNKLTFNEEINWLDEQAKLYYPHGNIVLGVNISGEEGKIKYHPPETLLQTILDKWSNDTNFYPLFICEGSSIEKVKSISRSYYLNYIYRNILPKLPKNIICYGWSLSENDEHILKQILKDNSEPFKIFISIHKGHKKDHILNAECTKIIERITNINNNTDIHFFNADDEGCWLNYNPD